LPAQRRFTRADWIAAAREVLISSGVDAVKVDRLAKTMQVTRGSFYWHFQHHDDLLTALLQDWEARNYFEIAQVRARWAQSDPDLSEIVAIWMDDEEGAASIGMGIRIWAQKDVKVAEAVHRVDDEWIALLEELFRKSGYADPEAFVRARIVYFHQVGYYALAIRESLEERLQLVPYYYKALTGKDPGIKLATVIDHLATRSRPVGRSRRRRAASG
jgi:AcrR family transcriptional regulator